MGTSLDRFAARARSPRAWRIRTRRLFLLTLPLSLPLWLVLLVGLCIVFAARAVSTPIVTFWNAPPKRARHSYYGYGDGSSRGRAEPENVVPLPPRQPAEADLPHQAERG